MALSIMTSTFGKTKEEIEEGMLTGRYVWKKINEGYANPSWELFEVSYVGAVLSLREMNGYNDSDFYAGVWDSESEEIKSVQYATTRGWTYANGAVCDATDEVIEAARQHQMAKLENVIRNAEISKAQEARVGRAVEVVKGRKIAKGITGRVFWRGPDRFRKSRYGSSPNRVGIETKVGDRVFTAEDNVEVQSHEQYMRPAYQIHNQASAESYRQAEQWKANRRACVCG